MADVNKTLKDALYVTVGLGVLGYKQAQERRRGLRKQAPGLISAPLRFARSSVESQVADTTAQLQKLAKQVEGRVDPLRRQLKGRLPDNAQDLVKQARTAAKDAQGQMQRRLRRTPVAA